MKRNRTPYGHGSGRGGKNTPAFERSAIMVHRLLQKNSYLISPTHTHNNYVYVYEEVTT